MHTALLREIRLAPRAVVKAAGTSRRHHARVARHLQLVLDILQHHHAGQNRLLLPVLRARVPREALAAVDAAAAQHTRIEALVADVRAALGPWVRGPRTAPRGLVADLIALAAHLHGHEQTVLPLAARYLDDAQRQAIGEAGFAAIPTPALALALGMLMSDSDPVVPDSMLAHAPAPARMLLPRIAPALHARRCRAVHGV